ncbi:hypothetical protein WJX73_005679 [Symbiochloris irregularis]|uniref:Uncharacterized protein n=1 Tax=Symbiochloris irregularis TaxID=706552 RepID=A0AAW1NQ46_9CHLO
MGVTAVTARRRRPPETMLDSIRGEDGEAVVSGAPVPITTTATPEYDSYGEWTRWLEIVRIVIFVVAVLGAITWSLAGTDFSALPAQLRRLPLVTKMLGQHSPLHHCNRPTPSYLLAHFGDLGSFSFPIHTDRPVTQRLFDLGLLQEWNFNQGEALEAFTAGMEFAPHVAMLHFGRAYALGPGANRAFTQQRQLYPSVALEDIPAIRAVAGQAYVAAQEAMRQEPQDQQLAARELALTDCLYRKRYAKGSDASLEAALAAEEAYARCLADLGSTWGDAAVLAMAAESYMNLFPWDYYQGAKGAMKPLAARAEELIDQALSRDPFNPLALHLHIHIAEASSTQRKPGKGRRSAHRAVGSADTLHWSRGPWAAHMGHLQHMPSHTFITVGRWSDAVDANINASRADDRVVRGCMHPYEPEHNTQMLIYAANMAGRFEDARHYAASIRTYAQHYAPELATTIGPQWAELVLTLVQQGSWAEVMRDIGRAPPKNARGMCPQGGVAFSGAVHLFAQSMSVMAKAAGLMQAGDTAEAVEQYVRGGDTLAAKLQDAADAMEPEEGTVPGAWPGIYACDYANLTQIMALTASARLSVLHGDLASAERLLRDAVAIEDVLGYMEPPRQYQPVRHCLGYVQSLAGNHTAAEQVFRADLRDHLDNGRALLGLAHSLEAQGRAAEAEEAHQQHLAAWHGSPLASACLSFSESVPGISTSWGRRLTL